RLYRGGGRRPARRLGRDGGERLPHRAGVVAAAAGRGWAMTPERWQRIQALFEAALQRPPADRPALLAGARAGGTPPRTQVEGLLAHDEGAGQEDFLRTPTFTGPATPADVLTGRRVGPYQIEERLGSGGMGSVYRAVRCEGYRQEVAVKFITPGRESAE